MSERKLQQQRDLAENEVSQTFVNKIGLQIIFCVVIATIVMHSGNKIYLFCI